MSLIRGRNITKLIVKRPFLVIFLIIFFSYLLVFPMGVVLSMWLNSGLVPQVAALITVAGVIILSAYVGLITHLYMALPGSADDVSRSRNRIIGAVFDDRYLKAQYKLLLILKLFFVYWQDKRERRARFNLSLSELTGLYRPSTPGQPER